MYWALSSVVAALGIVIWWLFFSRAPHAERWVLFLLAILAVYATSKNLHMSLAGAGMGMMFVFYSVPLVILAFLAAVVVTSRLSAGPRRAALAAVILLASGVWTLVRIDGVRTAGGLDIHWRWTPTPEQLLLAHAAPLPEPPAAAPATPAAEEAPKEPASAPAREEPAASTAAPPPAAPAEPVADWPGFRGPHRDSIVHGVHIATDWAASPPVELWRRAVGPGWSSFAVHGDLFYTQEQRGEEEVVACYNRKTGEPVWMHSDTTRFWEANAGAGPRGTPTVSNGRVYSFGATGIVNALDAATGALVWSRKATEDAKVKVPYWGIASSPLVIDDKVIIAAAGRLVAYDAATGEPRWLGPSGGGGYASPQVATVDGVTQILLLRGSGVISVSPADGSELWQHPWPGASMLQPAQTADGDILITANDISGGVGTRRLALTHAAGSWTAQERWTTRGLKPYFNDLVVHKGHAFGFDGRILACIDLADGQRKWKGGRYGNGQLVLLPDQDVLLVLSEDGELALVAASTSEFKELARFPAIEGKTWNHPVLAGDILLVRNDHEMAAFRLP